MSTKKRNVKKRKIRKSTSKLLLAGPDSVWLLWTAGSVKSGWPGGNT